ncbi:MAG: bifunctional pyr operon transcriptional regulator/uracil phosphoribosyltransferase [Rhodoferax sp.]|nr:bifunctional pyr operon transcriptional regulator/uracil phosphoribosyltransferase [Rhodoferax sp.]
MTPSTTPSGAPSGVPQGAAQPPEGANAASGGSEVRAATSAGALLLDAEALYRELLRGVQMLRTPATRLVGVTSGGAWLAERLQADMQLPDAPGVISSAMHRDDFSKRGMVSGSGGQTALAFDVNGAEIILLDDVLYTGRTIRAVLNELFDYGRPASVKLAVLVDRGGRELPVQADFASARVTLASTQLLALARDAAGGFSFRIEARDEA